MNRRDDPEGHGCHEGSGGDREDPGPDDATRNAPLDGRKTACGADADDRARNCVCGRDRRAGERDVSKRECRRGLGAESANGF